MGTRWTSSEKALLASLRAKNPALSNRKLAKLFVDKNIENTRSLATVTTRIYNFPDLNTAKPHTTKNPEHRNSASVPLNSQLKEDEDEMSSVPSDESEVDELATAGADEIAEAEQSDIATIGSTPSPARRLLDSPSQAASSSPARTSSSTHSAASDRRAKAHRQLVKEQKKLVEMQARLVQLAEGELADAEAGEEDE